MSNYTPKEAKAINDAWADVEHMADCSNHTDSRMVADMLRIERKERGGALNARALLLNCMADTRLNSVADLYGVSPGCQAAYILAADWRTRRAKQFAAILPKIQLAAEIQDGSIRRRLAAL